ncbi:MAG: HAD-superfamily hydrolase, subfamily variant 3 [Candidatus Saccharibacteria bacterium]|nr:HAD-superfamily hydrolase, subfamily variant 3 [Candidatus Saccharibacteria bacterium]MDB5180349.1 HAD-superfamily hydrolase, subfamily variant 3 [Candidatus Saccharibacteria bacterium]
MIKAIIFDCFGVFIGNPYKLRAQALDQSDPEKGKLLHDINRASDRGYLSRDETAKQMAELIGISTEQFLAEQDKGEIRDEDLVAYVKTLRPQFKLAMLSNISSRERLELRFEQGQLDELFDVVVASGDEGYIKPEPEIYEIALARLGVKPEECVMLDDILEYCQGAEAVGLHAIQYFNLQQAITDLNALIDRGGKTD